MPRKMLILPAYPLPTPSPKVELQIILIMNQILYCAGKLLFTGFMTVLYIRSTNIGIIPILFFFSCSYFMKCC